MNPIILVVDDEEANRLTLTRILSREGYDVRQAEDGRQAMIRLHEDAPHLLLTDLKMPGMSGPELFHEIEGTGEDEAARVIFITGDTLSSDTSAFVSSVKNPVLN